MVNFAAAVTSASLLGGAIMLAIWAFAEYRSHLRQQEAQRTSYREAPRDRDTPACPRKAPPQPGNECSICQDDLSPPLEILPCNHLFHRQCIRKWFERRMVCAVCRSPITGDVAQDYVRRLNL